MKKQNKKSNSVKKAAPKKAAKKAAKKAVKKAAKKAAKKAVKKAAPKKAAPKKAAKKSAPKKVVKPASKPTVKASKKKKAAPKKVVKKAAPKKGKDKKTKNVVKKVVTTTTTTTTITSVNPTETHYLLILDESGSMGNVRESTFNGLNEQIQTIKNLSSQYPDQKYYINIVKFSDNVSPLIENIEASQAKEFKVSDYSPNGMTALHDAIGVSVNNLNSRIQSRINSGEASAFVVILTDGDENVSREYNAAKIKTLITDLEKGGMWTFSFIGANQDSVLTAKNLGVNVSNTINYTASSAGTSLSFATLGASLNKRAAYTSAGLYAATTDNLMSSVTNGLANIGEDASLLDLSGNVTKEELDKAAESLKLKNSNNSSSSNA